DLQANLGAEITKSARFTPKRDIEVDIEFTNWRAGRDNHFPISNATGMPVNATVSLTGRAGTIRAETKIVPTSDPFDWVLHWEVPASHAGPELCVQNSGYIWRGGALLEANDLRARNGEALGFLRSEGYEYSSIRSFHSTTSRATLILHLPL